VIGKFEHVDMFRVYFFINVRLLASDNIIQCHVVRITGRDKHSVRAVRVDGGEVGKHGVSVEHGGTRLLFH